MKSPCKNVCELNDENVCVGCGRTLEEIVNWGKMSEEERKQIIERLNNKKD